MSRSVREQKRPTPPSRARARGDADTSTPTAPTQDPKKKRKRSRSDSPQRPAKKQELESTTAMDVVAGLPTKPIPLDPLDVTRRDIRVLAPFEAPPDHAPDQDHKVTLGSLYMKTGPLEKLLPGDGGWPTIAADMKAVLKADRTGIAELGKVYYTPGRRDPVGNANSALLGEAKMTDTINFLETFMRANGQWDYIEKQDWYTKDSDYVIAIDMNYYPNRNIINDSPGFHKDTAGDNIFVNLIFDNKADIEATEWFADTAEPSTKRASWQQKLLPESHLKELADARKTLQPDPIVEGGISEGKYIYVSWVDDLIWHATPASPRKVYTPADAARDYPKFASAYKYTPPSRVDVFQAIAASPETHLSKWLKDQGLKAQDLDAGLAGRALRELYQGDDGKARSSADQKSQGYQKLIARRNQQDSRAERGTEILGTIAESTGTHLQKWLESQGLKAQDIDGAMARTAWLALYRGTAGQERYRQDVKQRAQTDWRVTGAPSEAIAKVDYLAGSRSMDETPMGLSGRRRRASLEQAKVQQVRKANKDVPRTFLRTWVRIVRKDSDELKTAGLAY